MKYDWNYETYLNLHNKFSINPNNTKFKRLKGMCYEAEGIKTTRFYEIRILNVYSVTLKMSHNLYVRLFFCH